MRMKGVRKFVLMAAAMLFAAAVVGAQVKEPENTYKSQEISEDDGVPVLMKHLPDYDKVASQAVFAKDLPTLKAALGDRPELNVIDFTAGTEAVTANYPTGKLLIIEYSSPQLSAEADAAFQQAASTNGSLVYRRIGNYNALVFDATDRAAANDLLDQVHYEKHIQWLGNNPFRISAEKAFIMQTEDLFVSTLEVVGAAILVAILIGLVVGFLYFRKMDRKRARMAAFSDAGGMTRLNLDGFTPDILPDRLLGE
ncbi:MAG: hypothetical protein ACJ73D_13425 [Pyrinomonadaceae bacterium]